MRFKTKIERERNPRESYVKLLRTSSSSQQQCPDKNSNKTKAAKINKTARLAKKLTAEIE